MFSKLRDRKLAKPKSPCKVSDYLPCATPFRPGLSAPAPLTVASGNYTLLRKVSGQAKVRFLRNKSINRVVVNYTGYSDDQGTVLNSFEDVIVSVKPPKVWDDKLERYSYILQAKFGLVTGTKRPFMDGFHLRIDAMTIILNANETLTTTIGGRKCKQPANGI